MRKVQLGALFNLLLFFLVACIPGKAQTGQVTVTEPVITSTAVINPAPSVTATNPAKPSTPGINPTPGATASEVPVNAGDAGVKTITLDNNGQKISLHPDETFLLRLGELYQWNIVIDDQAVISRIPNIMVIRGAQGIYKAHQAGKATLTADGDPLCRQTKPACGMPSIRFTLQIEVLP